MTDPSYVVAIADRESRLFNAKINDLSRLKALKAQISAIQAKQLGAGKEGKNFKGFKLRPKYPPSFNGEASEKFPMKNWLALVEEWLDTGACVPEQRANMAATS